VKKYNISNIITVLLTQYLYSDLVLTVRLINKPHMIVLAHKQHIYIVYGEAIWKEFNHGFTIVLIL